MKESRGELRKARLDVEACSNHDGWRLSTEATRLPHALLRICLAIILILMGMKLLWH